VLASYGRRRDFDTVVFDKLFPCFLAGSWKNIKERDVRLLK